MFLTSNIFHFPLLFLSINTAWFNVVVNFGTETRIADPSKKVNATPDKTSQFVNFLAADIKDLFVHEENQGGAAPAAAVPAAAPIEQKPRPQKPPKQHHQQQQQQQQQPARKQHATGTGDHLLSLRVKAGAGDASGPDADKGDFDFNANLSVFNKTEELAKVADENERSGTTKYVKDDFFDSLSCDVLDRQEGRKTRVTASEERTQNLDTFGAVALQNNYRRYGRGRGGRGRGGRGDGRGGRGGRGRGRGYGGAQGQTA